MHIRDADPDRHSAACAEIYAPYVRETVIPFEDSPPDAQEMSRRITELSARYPWLVAEEDGRVIGYTYASPHRQRAAYRWAADVAIYVAAGHHRRGVGRALYEALFEHMTAQDLRMACAGITLPNPASVALHESVGFESVGVYRRIGWKGDAWHDVAWFQRPLATAGADPPTEPSPGAPEIFRGDRA